MFDYHVHTSLCNHATGTMEQVVREAVAKGMATICFLDHLTFKEAVGANAIFPREVPKYLDVLESMLDYGHFDVICHLDLPKTYNKRPSPPAVQGFLDVLEKIRQKDLAVGLNNQRVSLFRERGLSLTGPDRRRRAPASGRSLPSAAGSRSTSEKPDPAPDFPCYRGEG